MRELANGERWYHGPPVWMVTPPEAIVSNANQILRGTPAFKTLVLRFEQLVNEQNEKIKKGCNCTYCSAAKLNFKLEP